MEHHITWWSTNRSSNFLFWILKGETTSHQTSSIKQYRQIKCSSIFDAKVFMHANDAQHENKSSKKIIDP